MGIFDGVPSTVALVLYEISKSISRDRAPFLSFTCVFVIC